MARILHPMSLADQLTLIRIAAVPMVVVLFLWDFDGHYWWATAVFKLKTWSQATAAAIGGFAAAGAWDDTVAWWALLVAVVLTWLSGLDYARIAPGVLRGRPVAP
jgi:phosphatidylglycerophosphate synthase